MMAEFVLKQNFGRVADTLEAIKNTVSSVIPVDIRMPINYENKKMNAEPE